MVEGLRAGRVVRVDSQIPMTDRPADCTGGQADARLTDRPAGCTGGQADARQARSSQRAWAGMLTDRPVGCQAACGWRSTPVRRSISLSVCPSVCPHTLPPACLCAAGSAAPGSAPATSVRLVHDINRTEALAGLTAADRQITAWWHSLRDRPDFRCSRGV
jgi:hypothetical protein